MSKVLRKHENENYSPKAEPEILSKILETSPNSVLREKYPESKVLENIISTNEPWLGCCGYLLCFTPMYMAIERKRGYDFYSDEKTLRLFNGSYGLGGENCDISLLNRERLYKVYLTVTGMGLANHFDPLSAGENQSYRFSDDYVKKSMAFSGYAYQSMTKDAYSKEQLLNEIITSINSLNPLLFMTYNTEWDKQWKLIIGYDTVNDLLIERKGTGTETVKNWFATLCKLVSVTQTGLEKNDYKDVLRDIITTMESTHLNGIPIGISSYHDCLDFLANKEYFDHVDFDTLCKNYNSLHNFFGYHAESRGFSGMGFQWCYGNESDEENYIRLLDKLSSLGDAHHNLAWNGWNAMLAFPYDIEAHADVLRNDAVRGELMKAVHTLIENDATIVKEIRDYFSHNTFENI